MFAAARGRLIVANRRMRGLCVAHLRRPVPLLARRLFLSAQSVHLVLASVCRPFGLLVQRMGLTRQGHLTLQCMAETRIAPDCKRMAKRTGAKGEGTCPGRITERPRQSGGCLAMLNLAQADKQARTAKRPFVIHARAPD